MSTRPGRLVVLEGPEGAGKSTQARHLGAWLERAGLPHVMVREPGGTPLAETIRAIVLDPGSEIAAPVEALLYQSARADLTVRVIVPALERGALVIADRFFLSTYAYQGGGRGLPVDLLRAASALATGGLAPDLTLLLFVPATTRRVRAGRRGALDRIERAGDDFHDRVERAFASFVTPEWQARHPECGPIVGIDGSGSEDEVAGRIRRTLVARWPEPFSALHRSHSS